MKVKIFISIGLMLLLILLAAPVYANGIPALPHAFHGTVTINGAAAPVGTEIEATGTGVTTDIAQNPVTTTVVGQYGTGGLYLLVQGDILDGTTITFYVNGVQADQTAPWHSGETTEQNLAVTVMVGGGGGGAPAAPAVTTISPTGLSATVPLQVDAQGIVQATTRLTTDDGKLSLDIAQGTRLLDAQGNPLTSLSAAPEPLPPAPPPAGAVLLAYDLGPDGATFSPPITLTIEYDPEALPEGLAEEDLYIAYWDGTEWIFLETMVDTTAKTVSCQVSHFTIFAVVATDTTPPVISAVSASDVSDDSAIITWTTDEPSTSQVEYWVTTSSLWSLDTTLVTSHSVTLTDLDSETTYNFSVRSSDAAGNLAISDEYTFTTSAAVAAAANWALIGGIIGGVVVAGGLAWYFWWRRRG